MTALLIILGVLLVAMFGCAVLCPQSSWSGRDTEEQARMMVVIAMSVV